MRWKSYARGVGSGKTIRSVIMCPSRSVYLRCISESYITERLHVSFCAGQSVGPLVSLSIASSSKSSRKPIASAIVSKV